MKYTYQISFTGSDYSDLFFTNKPELKGEWVEGTMIWREKINELKINKHLNYATFDTLNTWFTDPTKFETKIYVRILNSGVQESLHWFGIKWGTIDINLTNYTVEPELYDNYSNYIQPYWNDHTLLTDNYDSIMSLVAHTGNYAVVYRLGLSSTAQPKNELLETFIKHKIQEITPLLTTDVVSNFLFGDNEEDGTPATYTYGMLINNVTTRNNILKYACIAMDIKSFNNFTLKDIFDMLTLFNVYGFFDSVGKLRFEHLSWFIHELEANTILIDTHPIEQIYTYNISEIITHEVIEMASGGADDSASDWSRLPIKYSDVRNREDLQVKTHFFSSYYTNASYYYQHVSSILSFMLLTAGYKNLVMNWVNVDMNTFAATGNYLDFDASINQICASKDFYVGSGIEITIVLTVLTGELEIAVYDRSTGLLNSDTLSVTTTGTTIGSLTLINPSETDSYLKIREVIGGSTEGYILGEFSGTENLYINPWAAGGKSTSQIMNGDFSKANLIADYWKDGRMSLSGYMNDTLTTFNSTMYNLERKDVKQFFSTTPNPLHGIFDNNRIGRISGWTRNLNTGYIDLILKYQEDDGRVFLTDGDGNLLTDEFGNPLIE